MSTFMDFLLWTWFMRAVIAAATVQVSSGYAKNNEGQIRDYLLSQVNYSSNDRPVDDSRDSVNVTMGLTLFTMMDLNERDQVLTTNCWISLRWQDNRLAWNASDFGNETTVAMYPEEIWTPSIFISNSLDTESMSITSPGRGVLLLTLDGIVSLATTIVLSTKCRLMVQYFPYDTQLCPLYFFPENQPTEKISLISSSPIDASENDDSNEWTVVNFTSNNGEYLLPGRTPNNPTSLLSYGVYCLFLQRDPSYYISTLVIPSSVLLLLAFATFCLPPDCGERISLGVSLLLGLTVFQLLVADILPTTKGSPILNQYLSRNFIIACFTVAFSLMNIKIAYGDSKFFLLKFSCTRKLFVEYLPRITMVPSYTERIRNIGTDHTHPVQTKEIHRNQVESDFPVTSSTHEYNVSKREKDKIEARTVALVMDKLLLFAFLITFAIFFISTIIQFNQNPGVPPYSCKDY